MWLRNTILVFTACALSVTSAGKFKVSREWSYLNFTWPSAEAYQTAVSQRLYIPENNIISGITHFEDYFYVTLPRMKSGVPATLARIAAGITKDTSPLLEPFPTWEMNSLDDCNALQNVQNVEVDPKGQMWIIDGGKTETLSPVDTYRCPPKLVIYDIKRNMTTTAYTFPENVASQNSSFLYDIVVDNTDGGYAYITDNGRKDPGIIVFSVKDHHSWKIRHSKTMKAEPTATTFRVKETIVSDPINIAGIALGPKIHTSDDRIIVNEDREVFFSPLSSLHLYSVNTTVLRNEQNGMNDGEYQGELKDHGLKASQSIGMIMDNQGILYYSLLSTYSIARWDSHTSFESGQKVIARDDNFLEWPNSFTFDQTGNITVLVNRLNKFIYDKLNLDEVNFRLITAHVGGKSYLYDQEYDYRFDQNTSTTSTTPVDLPEPHMLPGTDQDPYLTPVPQPEGKLEPEPAPEPAPEPSPEPVSTSEHTPEPEPTPEPTADHSNDTTMVNETEHNHQEGIVNDQPMNDRPMHDQPMNDQPMHDQPMSDQPMHDQPMNDQRMHEQPLNNQPMNEQPMNDQPIHSHPASDHMDHDHMNHDHMNHDHMEQNQTSTVRNDSENEIASANAEMSRKLNEGTSGTTKLVATFVGVLFAGALFAL